MIDKRVLTNTQIYKDLEQKDTTYWFDFKKSKFLHNIDTFYYSVKLVNDFTLNSQEFSVAYFRAFFRTLESRLIKAGYDSVLPITFGSVGLNYTGGKFAKYHSIHLECPEYFDIFIAPVVPNGTGLSSITCEIVVQLRSYLLWMFGVNRAFEKSYEYVKEIIKFFKLEIAYAQENRIDYCWHSNYLSNPEYYFRTDNFYKMRVDRFKECNQHSEKVGSEDYEIDYLSIGKRSDKCFIRIYLKTKEVIEKGYKAWFFKVWFFNGLINRYDLYVYEHCFLKRSWKYRYMARLKFYSEYGTNESYKQECKDLVDGKNTISDDCLIALADKLTPKINLIMNVEYQTMRRHSKSYTLLPFKDNSKYQECKRIYDYFDNRRLICDYLTKECFRLVTPTGDSNKARRDYNPFWKALRSCKMVDVTVAPKNLKLVRQYNTKLNLEIMKKRAINSCITLGLYARGINYDFVEQDCVEALCMLNDNDIHEGMRYKTKKIKQLNADELSDVFVTSNKHDYEILDTNTGLISQFKGNTIHL